MKKLVKISELCSSLGLINSQTNKPLNHVLRYWEKEFLQIKPKKINNQRYYTEKDVEIIKFIKYLIKEKKISIAGVKSILKSNIKKLDVRKRDSLNLEYLKTKSIKILSKIKRIKSYGKKNSS